MKATTCDDLATQEKSIFSLCRTVSTIIRVGENSLTGQLPKTLRWHTGHIKKVRYVRISA